jgi:hypothetical protein
LITNIEVEIRHIGFPGVSHFESTNIDVASFPSASTSKAIEDGWGARPYHTSVTQDFSTELARNITDYKRRKLHSSVQISASRSQLRLHYVFLLLPCQSAALQSFDEARASRKHI